MKSLRFCSVHVLYGHLHQDMHLVLLLAGGTCEPIGVICTNLRGTSGAGGGETKKLFC